MKLAGGVSDGRVGTVDMTIGSEVLAKLGVALGAEVTDAT